MKTTELIVALDYNSMEEAIKLVDTLGDSVKWFKVGSQLFTRYGTAVVSELKKRNKKVFLDLKFHDIPNTVSKAVASAAAIGADMVNVHASGGFEMMHEAVRSGKEANSEMLVIAVTVLTSMDDSKLSETLNWPRPGYTAEEHVGHLAKLAKSAGLDGVVASAYEIRVIRELCGKDFILVIPGIRPAGSSKDDQKRIVTPAQAADEGAEFIVVGRPITAAKDPAFAARAILDELTIRRNA